MKSTAHQPRPTIAEFMACCRTEFRFLEKLGFREISKEEPNSSDPFRFLMSNGSLHLFVHGVSYGLGASVRIRSQTGHETSVNALVATSRKARRIQHRERPDAQRATIAAAACVLRESPSIIKSGESFNSSTGDLG